ncbi:hypothetical protein Tco_0733208, partial [Tanacetum coccineum]
TGKVSDTRETKRGSKVEAKCRIRVCSWNVGSLTGKLLELVDVLERHKVDRACSWTARNSIGVILKACVKDKVVHMNQCSDKIISLTLVIEGETVNVISTAVKDSLGMAIGKSKTHTARKESWWLYEEVQSKVTVKQASFRELLLCREGNQEKWIRVQERY